MKKPQKIKNRIVLIVLAILVAAFVFLILYFDIFNFQASVSDTASDGATTQANITYQDADGAVQNISSNVVKVKKVKLFPVTMTLQGKSDSKVDLSATLLISRYDSGSKTDQSYGPFEFSYNYKTKKWSSPDWTVSKPIKANGKTPPDLDLDLKYNLTLASPGYLPVIVPDQTLTKISNIKVSLLAGNVNNDNAINRDDYTKWVAEYGKKSSSSSKLTSYDFNNDGVIDYRDFAMVYGSNNYNQKVVNP